MVLNGHIVSQGYTPVNSSHFKHGMLCSSVFCCISQAPTKAVFSNIQSSWGHNPESKSWLPTGTWNGIVKHVCGIKLTYKWGSKSSVSYNAHALFTQAAQVLYDPSRIEGCPIKLPLSSDDKKTKMVVEDISMPPLPHAST